MMGKNNKKFVCSDCFRLKKCREPLINWVFFLTALVATIAIRAVNLFMDFDPNMAKALWYIGIIGFFVFFLYKFRYDNMLHKELENTGLKDKLLRKEELLDHDREILGTIICGLSSKKDKINYFFIFLTSGLALILAIWVDFFKK